MGKSAAYKSYDEIINDFLKAKARTDILGTDFKPTENQINELKNILDVYGIHALSRSRKHKVLSEKTLACVLPRFLKLNLDGFVDRLRKIESLSSKNCWEYYVLTYGEEQANILWQNKAKKCAINENKIGKDRYDKWIEDRSKPLLDRWKEKYGELEATKKFEEYSKNLSKSRSLEGYIEKYGEILGKEKYNERYKNTNSSEYKTYARKVHRLSEKIYTENIDIINPNRYIRTLCGIENGWQLDHIIPIKECFNRGMSPEEAANIKNLRMLPWKENLMRNYVNNY